MRPLTTQTMKLCRDCGGAVSLSETCTTCGSRRSISHPELNQLSIAHVDCDAFYCSIEKRDNPALRDKPVVVGGGRRGVVSAACYHARIYGVRSAMPMFQALKLCPNLTVIKGSMDKYGYEGGRIRDMMRSLTPLVEPLSIDEAFLDLTGTERLHGRSPAQSLIQLQNDILKQVGVTVSVGLSYNKFLAKTASDLDKPNGFAVLGQEDALDFLAKQSVGFGDHGLRLARLARGEDHRRVNPTSDRKSVSAETTFNTDISDLEDLKDKLWQVCMKTADRSKAKDLAGRTLTLKLKTAQFKSITRRRTLQQPVQLADKIFSELEPLLEAEVDGQKSYRLIGKNRPSVVPLKGRVT